MPWDDGLNWGIDDPLYTDDDPYANWGGGAGGDGSNGSDDPYANWGGGAGGDGTNGSGDASGGGFGMPNLSSVLSVGGNAIATLFKSLGIVGKDGSLNLGNLLSFLGVAGGGINAANATGKASQQMQDAANKANDLATARIDGAAANYKPYIDAGQAAVGKMANFDTSPLGAKFVAQGTPSNLSAKFASAPLTLGAIAARR